ncbi:MAG: metallophosphoesterase [Candidatus Woesearchaeota archaeon]
MSTITKRVVELLLSKKVIPTKELVASFKTVHDAELWLNKNTSKSEPEVEETAQAQIKVLFSYSGQPRDRTVSDFIALFNSRYRTLEKILKQRGELSNVVSIARITTKHYSDEASLIGMVYEKEMTKTGNIILTVEDPTGMIKVFVPSSSKLITIAQDIVLDEVIGVVGQFRNGMVYAQNIFHPDIPIKTSLKRAPQDVAMAVLSCIHVGSTKFLRKEFSRFIDWLCGDFGSNEQRELAKKIRYLFIIGDCVDGVGIYPNQERSLDIDDVQKQYLELTRYLKKIPKNVKLIICPGNHDATRLSEPQPPFPSKWSMPLLELENAIFVSNPALVNIAAFGDFGGFDVLCYHGFGFDDYSETVPSIKNSGKNVSERTPQIMRFLLQKRHIAPTYGSTLQVPEQKDWLTIERIPDIWISGHIHRAATASYRGVLLVCASCWQEKTDFQEKMGHEPTPCVVPVVDLHKRKTIMLNFADRNYDGLSS